MGAYLRSLVWQNAGPVIGRGLVLLLVAATAAEGCNSPRKPPVSEPESNRDSARHLNSAAAGHEPGPAERQAGSSFEGHAKAGDHHDSDYDPELASHRYKMYDAVMRMYPNLLPYSDFNATWSVMFPIGKWEKMFYCGPEKVPFGGPSKHPGDRNLSCYVYRAGRPVQTWSIWLGGEQAQEGWSGTLRQAVHGCPVKIPTPAAALADLANTGSLAAYTYIEGDGAVAHQILSNDPDQSFYESGHLDLAWPVKHKRFPVGYLEWQAMSPGDKAAPPRGGKS